MILFNAALVGAYWERLRLLRLERRRVAGRGPPSARRSEGQPGYSGELRVHLHRHRAPIMATQPTALLSRLSRLPTAGLWKSGLLGIPRLFRSSGLWIPGLFGQPLTPVLRAIDPPATRDSPATLVPRVTDRQATRNTPTPDPRPLRRQATRDSPLSRVLRAMDTRARGPILLSGLSKIPSLAMPAIPL